MQAAKRKLGRFERVQVCICMAMSAVQRSAYTALAPLLTSVGLFLARTLSVRRGSSKGALSSPSFWPHARAAVRMLAAAARALPQSVGAMILLMAFCGLLAWLLVVLLHVDPLTAYLATSPGGVDAATIIAASTEVDMPFVMAMQTVRMIMLLVVGPPVARWVAGTLDRAPPNLEMVRSPDLGDLD